MDIDFISKEIHDKCTNSFYAKRYVKFIFMCIKANETDLTDDVYTENHHILPKAKNFWPQYHSFRDHHWNKSVLTARQHFIAHWLLSKALGGHMWFALYNMIYAHNSSHKRVKPKSSKIYEISRIEFCKAMSDRVVTDEYRNKMSILTRGKNNPRYGETLKEETKNKISNSLKGHKRTKESIDKQKESFSDYWESDKGKERKERLSSSMKNKVLRPPGWKMSDQQKREVSEKVSNTIWINDGETTKRINKDEDIPDGFVRGRGSLKKKNKNE